MTQMNKIKIRWVYFLCPSFGVILVFIYVIELTARVDLPVLIQYTLFLWPKSASYFRNTMLKNYLNTKKKKEVKVSHNYFLSRQRTHLIECNYTKYSLLEKSYLCCQLIE